MMTNCEGQNPQEILCCVYIFSSMWIPGTLEEWSFDFEMNEKGVDLFQLSPRKTRNIVMMFM